MKKSYLSTWLILSVLLVSSLFLAGCGGSGGGSDSSIHSNVRVQLRLESADVAYPVDGMTVSIQKAGGNVLSGITDTNGIAVIPVNKTGSYQVIKVEGVDATALAEGSEAGREFKKSNPLADPYPNLIHAFDGAYPSVSVTESGADYTVNATVPVINKVMVLKAGNVTSGNSGSAYIFAGTHAFAGRIMISNLNCNDSDAILKIISDDTDTKLNLYMNTFGENPALTGGRFYVGESYTTLNPIGSYTQTGPIYFEAPGTDGGDWALGCNLSTTELKTRAAIAQNFHLFSGGLVHSIMQLWTRSTESSGHSYSFDYHIFQFEPF
ncbi:MAG: hypothetical protein WBN66_06140 [Smithella sp.]